MLMRHGIPGRLRLSLLSGEPQAAQVLAAELGGRWHGTSRCLLLSDPPRLVVLAAQLEARGWWLQVPELSALARPRPIGPWEQVGLEVGASLIGAAVGEPLGRLAGAAIAGPPGAVAGSFLGLVIGAVLATEGLHGLQSHDGLSTELNQAGNRVGGRVVGRLGEEAGALAGLRLGALVGGPIGASAGALIGTLLVGQLGEDAALRHTSQWRHPLSWLRSTGQAAAGEAVSQSLFGLLGGALLSTPGRKAGERLGLYLGRRINWVTGKPITVAVSRVHQQVGNHGKDQRIEEE